MASIKHLSPAKCILLAVTLASESNVKALYQLSPARPDVFDLALMLRILLTFLPETLNPSEYVTYVHEITTRVYLEQQEHVDVDCSAVDKLPEPEAERLLRNTRLLQLNDSTIPDSTINDPLISFLISRAHRIDSETRLLPYLSQLLEPFLSKSVHLRNWYISTVLPLIRLDFDYYPDLGPTSTLADFERLAGDSGFARLISKTEQNAHAGSATQETMARDFRGIVGPWVYGGMRRKRRKLNGVVPPSSSITGGQGEQQRVHEESDEVGAAPDAADWQPAFRWIVTRAVHDFKTASQVIEGWEGPQDIDLGDYQQGGRLEEHAELLAFQLKKQYCQAAFACIYACEENTRNVIDRSHSLLVRLAGLLEFEPPPDLATSIHLLPKIQRHSDKLENASSDYLRSEVLLEENNPLTKPVLETFSLLQLLVYSTYQLLGLGHNMPVAKITKLRFFSDGDEQLKVVQRILHGLIHGPKKDEGQWEYFRDTLLWLWDWAINDQPESEKDGYGLFGKVKRATMEKEILEALCQVGHYSLATRLYIENAKIQPLPLEEVDKIIVGVILQFFDNASNGNRTRGGAKKAYEILTAFQRYFPVSPSFRQCSALLAAAHSLSFYSLTLQRGIPFQPVTIRVNEEPLSLIEKVLAQNPRSYTKLDDLISIGRNVTIAHLNDPTTANKAIPFSISTNDETTQIRNAERRVIAMAISAALSEDDFETAYSYVVNRLTPFTAPPTSSEFATTSATKTAHDDISWRAALEAGRHRSTHPHPTSKPPSHLRRLEQRMELLSQSLVLAPPPHLPEVLASWRRCEEELLALLATEYAHAHDFDTRADKGETGMHVPGGIDASLALEPRFTVQPYRKEHGRGAREEAPMGLFDVARGAAQALGRNAGGVGVGGLQLGQVVGVADMARQQIEQRLHGFQGVLPGGAGVSGRIPSGGIGEDGRPDSAGGEAGRVRKRDMVANAFAGGIGWVLGAPPVGGGNTQ